MPKLVLFDQSESRKTHTVVMEEPPYNGEVEFDVVPKTRSLVMECMEKAKKNPIYNRHSKKDAEGKLRTFAGRPDDAFVQELAKEIVQDWRGVVDSSGVDVPCTDESKLMLFENIDVANFIVKAAGELGVVREEGAEQNLGE